MKLKSLLFAALVVASLPVSAADFRASVAQIRPVTLKDGIKGEGVVFTPSWVDALSAARGNQSFEAADWPVAPGLYRAVLFERQEVYAPDAQLLVPQPDGSHREIPRSKLVFFSGTISGDATPSIALSVDPSSKELRAFQMHEGRYELRPNRGDGARKGEHVLGEMRAFDDVSQTWSCGGESLPLTTPEAAKMAMAEASVEPAAISTLHQMTLIIDTDNEFMNYRFANNTTAAANFIATLINGMNVFYERDLLVRLVQGRTFLRVSTTPDPFNQSGTGSADGAKLQEYSNYAATSAEYAGQSRGLAAMLSGKQAGGGASGIAWINGLCNNTYGTSFSQLYRSGSTAGYADLMIVGHEIGHNFGADHTHCVGIDRCYNGQACYTGTRSCPAPSTYQGVTNVTGTLMSYCHVSGISGCSTSLVFHPQHVSQLSTIIQNRVGQCIFPATNVPPPAPTVTGIGPNNGPTTGGTVVTITGTNFAAGASVSFGGSAASSVTVVNSTTIRATTPARSTGTVTVTVTSSGGASGSMANAYFYAPPPTVSNFYTVSPCRVIDTRNPTGPQGGPALAGGAQRTVMIGGLCGIPATAKAVVANVAVVNPAAGGPLSIFAGNGIFTGTSVMNFSAGRVRASHAILPMATDNSGTVNVLNMSGGAAHFLIDVSGYFQ